MTEKELKEFLRKSVEAAWEAKAEPYLLSFVANDLKLQGQDYKSALAPEDRLKTFAERVQDTDHLFKVVQHPTQKAKVGLIPYEKEYAFPAPSSDDRRSVARVARTRNETALLSFLEALKALPDEVLDDIHIPTKALVLLLRQK